jgi:hypothetical protein
MITYSKILRLKLNKSAVIFYLVGSGVGSESGPNQTGSANTGYSNIKILLGALSAEATTSAGLSSDSS